MFKYFPCCFRKDDADSKKDQHSNINLNQLRTINDLKAANDESHSEQSASKKANTQIHDSNKEDSYKQVSHIISKCNIAELSNHLNEELSEVKEVKDNSASFSSLNSQDIIYKKSKNTEEVNLSKASSNHARTQKPHANGPSTFSSSLQKSKVEVITPLEEGNAQNKQFNIEDVQSPPLDKQFSNDQAFKLRINQKKHRLNTNKKNFNSALSFKYEESKSQSPTNKHELPSFIFTQTSHHISEDEAQQSSKLLLTNLKGNLLYSDIHINACGAEESMRNKKDGYTFFGIHKVDEVHPYSIQNDVLLNLSESFTPGELYPTQHKSSPDGNTGNLSNRGDRVDSEDTANIKQSDNVSRARRKPNFVVIYNKGKYIFKIIRPLNTKEQPLYFVKVSNILRIPKKCLVMIGGVYLCFNISQDRSKLEIIVIDKRNFNGDGSKSTLPKIIEFDSLRKTAFLIGRGQNDLSLENSNVSKLHCEVFLDFGAWYIGDGLNYRESMHGTWILVDSKWEINEDMILKYEENVFKIKIIDNK